LKSWSLSIPTYLAPRSATMSGEIVIPTRPASFPVTLIANLNRCRRQRLSIDNATQDVHAFSIRTFFSLQRNRQCSLRNQLIGRKWQRRQQPGPRHGRDRRLRGWRRDELGCSERQERHERRCARTDATRASSRTRTPSQRATNCEMNQVYSA
jgi:hypothetical protein